MTSSVTIVGVGAIGGWIAGLLDQAGWDVRLLARGATLAAVREHGLIIENPLTPAKAGVWTLVRSATPWRRPQPGSGSPDTVAGCGCRPERRRGSGRR